MRLILLLLLVIRRNRLLFRYLFFIRKYTTHGARWINEQRDLIGDNLRIIREKYCVCRIHLKRIIIVYFFLQHENLML